MLYRPTCNAFDNCCDPSLYFTLTTWKSSHESKNTDPVTYVLLYIYIYIYIYIYNYSYIGFSANNCVYINLHGGGQIK